MAPIPDGSLRSLLQLPRELLSSSLASTSSLTSSLLHRSLEASSPLAPIQRRDASIDASSSTPTRSITPALTKRQTYSAIAIPSSYAGIDDGPAAGTIVGIVLGSVAGFILLVWLLWTLANYSGSSAITAESIEVVRRSDLPRDDRSPTRNNHSSRRSTRRSRRTSERIEIRERSRSPRVGGAVIVEERRRVVSPAPPPVTTRETIIVEERREPRVPGDDIVEVLEGSSVSGSVARSHPPPRHESRRSSGRRVSGGYRSVDPNLFGGGDYPQHRVRRGSSVGSSLA
jgi:hypothetical protein